MTMHKGGNDDKAGCTDVIILICGIAFGIAVFFQLLRVFKFIDGN